MSIGFARRPGVPGVAVRLLLILGLGVAAIVWLASMKPIPQSQAFHNFADQRTLLGVPHFWNVVSDAPFLVLGLVGLWACLRRDLPVETGPFESNAERWPFILFFLGVALTAFGSAYYHLHPNDERLLWDRLPMSVAFTALIASIIADRVSRRAGVALLPLLVVVGIGSVLYWRQTDDLRPYYFVQFFPAVAIPLLLLMFPSRYTGTGYLWLGLFWYVLAKFAEHPLDRDIYAAGQWLSGHTLKHLLAAIGIYCILRMVMRRQPLVELPEPLGDLPT